MGNVLLGDGVTFAGGRSSGSLLRHADGWSTSSPVTDEEFRAMCRAFECADLVDDPRFARQVDRLGDPAYPEVYRHTVQPAAERLTVAEALGRLERGGAPAIAAVDVADVHGQPAGDRERDVPRVRAPGRLRPR